MEMVGLGVFQVLFILLKTPVEFTICKYQAYSITGILSIYDFK